jgi:hypothetical protein
MAGGDAQLAAVADARYLMRRAFRMIDTEARGVNVDPLAFRGWCSFSGPHNGTGPWGNWPSAWTPRQAGAADVDRRGARAEGLRARAGTVRGAARRPRRGATGAGTERVGRQLRGLPRRRSARPLTPHRTPSRQYRRASTARSGVTPLTDSPSSSILTARTAQHRMPAPHPDRRTAGRILAAQNPRRPQFPYISQGRQRATRPDAERDPSTWSGIGFPAWIASAAVRSAGRWPEGRPPS